MSLLAQSALGSVASIVRASENLVASDDGPDRIGRAAELDTITLCAIDAIARLADLIGMARPAAGPVDWSVTGSRDC